MTIFSRSFVERTRPGLEPFGAERTAAMTPSSELALTSLVVVALVASAAIISIAALGPQARHGVAGPPSSIGAVKPGMLEQAESEVLDLELYPACIDVGDGRFPSAPGERSLYPSAISRHSASNAIVHGGLASAKGGRASEGSPALPRSAAEPLPYPMANLGPRIGGLGCGPGGSK